MRVKTVAVSYGRKLNLGNYEAAELSASVWAEVEEGEDESAVMEYLFGACKAQVKNQVPPSYKRANPQLTSTFTKLGQPTTPDQMLAFDEDN